MAHEGVSSTVFVNGFIKGYARKAMNIQDITHNKHRDIIEHRIKVLNFYDRYGLAATKEAFAVSRSTVYLWKKKLKDSSGKLTALSPEDRAPKVRRRRNTDQIVIDYILNQRTQHPRLGKDKLQAGLKPVCSTHGIDCPSVSTVGRILKDLKDQGRLPEYGKVSHYARSKTIRAKSSKPKLKKDRRGDYYPSVAGDLVQLDCVIKFINGIRRYIISAIDYSSEFAFSMGYSSLSSAKSKDFLEKFIIVAPFEVKRIQTDNGSEFYKLFHESCVDKGLTHYWNYPRSPRMNAKIERYNRTIQEEYCDYNLEDMAYDIQLFNSKLIDWLIWYNTERPHWTLKLKSPMRGLIDNLQLEAEESNMLWTSTIA